MAELVDAILKIKEDTLRGIEVEIRDRAPSKSGNLRRSFRREGDEVVSRAPYANIVDRKRPYIDPALDAVIGGSFRL